ncbi:MAG: putative molybdenum carrier protein [Micrococcaceae bacterium]
MNPVISRIRTGGQSGVDRAALDAAKSLEVTITAWVPKGGWAEDFVTPPGLLTEYPELKETPSEDVEQRTEWNVRDSHATLIIASWAESCSPGTGFTVECAKNYKRPYFVVTDISKTEAEEVYKWVSGVGTGLTLNIAGPRESEAPGAYLETFKFITQLLKLNNSLR